MQKMMVEGVRVVGDSGLKSEFKRLHNFESIRVGRDPEFNKIRKKMMEGYGGGVSGYGGGGVNSDFNLGIKPNDPNNRSLLKNLGWSVMIIDDPNPNSGFDPLTRLHHLFLSSGCLVHASTEPSETMSSLKQKNDMVDFVICNIHMKGMDEATLFELVGLKGVPVIMMSSYMNTRLVTEGMNHGASLFVLKPQTLDDIENISSFLLEKRKYPSWFPWTLNHKFDQVVDQLGGLDEAVPEKILELMNAENIIPLKVIEERLKICRELARLTQLGGTEKGVAGLDFLPSGFRLGASYLSATSV